MNKKSLYIFFTLVLLLLINTNYLFSQEFLINLENNIKLKTGNYHNKSLKSIGTVKLPFKDDFSNKGPFPLDNLWQDRNVFINNDFPINPTTIGVATLDALNDTGAVHVNGSTTPFLADYLTSLPIRLDSLFGAQKKKTSKKDSIYLSFFYQPQGIGNAPEVNDSLVLEFFSSSDSLWYHIWSSPGMSYTNFKTKYKKDFVQVIIPIKDSVRYYKNNFQFRFVNYASLGDNIIPSWRSNCDQWHIDYVYLNSGRNKADTIYEDIAFVSSAQSMLKNYYAMPWKQYKGFEKNELKKSFNIKITNLSQVTKNTSYKYYVTNSNNTKTISYNGQSWNLTPFVPNGYQTYIPHANPPIFDTVVPFPANNDDTASFKIIHTLTEPTYGTDSIMFTQQFFNYYAYDDGCPEMGYGLTPAKSKLAYKFTLNKADTLKAIQIFFNTTLNNANIKTFYLMVWKSYSPEIVLMRKSGFSSKYTSHLRDYVTYDFSDNPIVLSGEFYIGVEQSTDDNLNIGFDLNNDAQDKIFYNTSGTWNNTQLKGALMIRPVFGKKITFDASVNEIANGLSFDIYPNPSGGLFNIKGISQANENYKVRVYDIYGKMVHDEISNFGSRHGLNLTHLTNGIYFVNIADENATVTKKIIINK